MPAGRAELLLPLRDPDAGHHAVQRLPVDVDDPQHVAQAVGRRVGHRFPDVALVQLGVADQRDEPAARPRSEVRVDIPPCGGGKQRRGGAEADRPGREVHAVRVLGPAGVGLQAAERSQGRQVGPVQVAQQVLDGVVHRRGVRLHAHPVRGVQVGKVERRHHRDQTRARGLMPANLDPVARLPVVVRRVHDPRREPEHSLLDLLQDGRVVSDRGRRGGHVLHDGLPAGRGVRGTSSSSVCVQATVTDLAREVRARQRRERAAHAETDRPPSPLPDCAVTYWSSPRSVARVHSSPDWRTTASARARRWSTRLRALSMRSRKRSTRSATGSAPGLLRR